jgi:CHASE1-domain containing sensor protein
MIKKQNDNKVDVQKVTHYPLYLPLMLTFAVGVIVSFILFEIVNNWERDNLRIEFESRSRGYANAIQYTIHYYVDSLNSVGDFFDNSEQVTRKEFSDFVLNAIARHPGIQAFSWNPLIQHSERAEYEARAQGTRGRI